MSRYQSMTNSALTIHYIADILSFKTSTKTLEEMLSNPSFDWEVIVVQGSKHLVLPALYCRLKERNLLHTLPTDLVDYLKEITNINRARNVRILNQVHSISKILNANNINHVFLKGTALLALGCYKDNAERMVGDIDILIETSQAQEAFNLLKNSGYNKTSGFAYDKKDFRHLDRLISEEELAAIELHTGLLNKKKWALIDIPGFIQNKRIVNNIAIPNKESLTKHLILSWQLNDHGHYYNAVSLKSIYDLISIKTHEEQVLLDNLLKLKYAKSYLELAKFYFTEFQNIESNNYMVFRKLMYDLKTSYKPITILINLTLYYIQYLGERIFLICTNKSYTIHILKKAFKN